MVIEGATSSSLNFLDPLAPHGLRFVNPNYVDLIRFKNIIHIKLYVNQI